MTLGRQGKAASFDPRTAVLIHELAALLFELLRLARQLRQLGDGWVDLEMTLGWPRCAPAERPLQMLATVG
jgi:hypothetical protein